jgi:hypothetical protein
MKYKKRNHEEGCYKNPTKIFGILFPFLLFGLNRDCVYSNGHWTEDKKHIHRITMKKDAIKTQQKENKISSSL